MTKYNRITGKVFGENATATGSNPEIGQFGSAQAGLYIGTTDVKTIQALPAWQRGWVGAVTPETNFPPLPEMTGVMKVLSQQQCYLLQQGIAEWDNPTIYYTNNFASKNGKIYISQTDENQGNDPATDTTNWKEFVSGGGVPIGTIFSVASSALYIPDGALPCNGQEYTKSLFNEFYTNFLVAGLLNTCTYEQYANDISIYGQCGRFALDTTNEKFKTPTIKDGTYITQAISDNELGKVYNESLPNIAGDFSGGGNYTPSSGAFRNTNSLLTSTGEGSAVRANLLWNFDASRSSSTYQDDAPVQGNNVRMRYFIQVANGSVQQSQIDWNQWFESLSTKANIDLSNLNAQGKAIIANYSMPSAKYVALTPTAGATYTAPADGWFNFRASLGLATGGYNLSKLINDSLSSTDAMQVGNYSTTSGGYHGIMIPAKKGDNVRLSWQGAIINSGGAEHSFVFYYAEGENE